MLPLYESHLKQLITFVCNIVVWMRLTEICGISVTCIIRNIAHTCCPINLQYVYNVSSGNTNSLYLQLNIHLPIKNVVTHCANAYSPVCFRHSPHPTVHFLDQRTADLHWLVGLSSILLYFIYFFTTSPNTMRGAASWWWLCNILAS